MGTFYAAARDPIFYAHHANIDRLWIIWVDKLGGKVFSDPDWLDSSFMFYNEEAKPVIVKVKDCLDPTTLGYVYEDIDIPWLDAKPTPRRKGVRVVTSELCQATQVFPTALDRVLNIVVRRPKKLRSKEEKEEAEEVLLVDEIKYVCSKPVKFDVYLNESDVKLCTPANSEFLGSFVDVPHHRHRTSTEKMSVRFAISSVLEELHGTDESEFLLVTLVPRCGDVTIASKSSA
ncbi:(+)-larreatricin hydroxylase, chloroplastic [Sesamum angolense]|uniref:(+)-larreatricin hydroxylase, chloroplastic n=1 Tax=Sesamum angolense TaxID=2727404 RepID=A0AAE2BH39_9LAMI|nr:(+)-larreatricin hydroxylase, chloroplastic [Sesamum angolense]